MDHQTINCFFCLVCWSLRKNRPTKSLVSGCAIQTTMMVRKVCFCPGLLTANYWNMLEQFLVLYYPSFYYVASFLHPSVPTSGSTNVKLHANMWYFKSPKRFLGKYQKKLLQKVSFMLKHWCTIYHTFLLFSPTGSFTYSLPPPPVFQYSEYFVVNMVK